MSLSSVLRHLHLVLIDVVNNEYVISILPLNFYQSRKQSLFIVGEHFYEEILLMKKIIVNI